jgi:hypothetical protein
VSILGWLLFHQAQLHSYNLLLFHQPPFRALS